MEKTVKGATKIKLAAPKSKYVEAILSATHGGEAGVAEVFRTLQLRLRDSTWTIVFKALIIVHLMIREGQPDLTLRYIAESPKRLAISNFTDGEHELVTIDLTQRRTSYTSPSGSTSPPSCGAHALTLDESVVQTQGANIRCYSDYLLERVRGFRDTKTDYVRIGAGKLKKLSIDKGLLREMEAVQNQIGALVKCDMVANDDPHNEITLTAFRLVTMDLLELFRVMNEGTINVLEHYFEMSRPDAERALNIYKVFGKQTHDVVQFLGLARKYEMSTRLEVPKLKHAPTTLTSSLEDYLNDPEFEINRRQYLAQQEAKKSGKPMPSSAMKSTPAFEKEVRTVASPPKSAPAATNPPVTQQPKGPAPDLIDFFESIEQNQQPMAQQNAPPQHFTGGYPQAQQYQQTAQQTGYNPFLPQGATYGQIPQQQQPQPQQPDFTGAGFGGYGPQSPQQQISQQNPYQSSLQSIPQNGMPSFAGPLESSVQAPPQQLQPQQTSTNPFRQSTMPTGGSVSSSVPPTRQSTNPFARSANAQQPSQQQSSSMFPMDTVSSPVSASSPFASPPPQSQHSDFQTNSSLFSQPSQSATSTISQPSPVPQLQSQRTGTNPFARNRSPPESNSEFQPAVTSPLVASPTGSTNPFRQSAFVNQQTGTGWQHSAQGTFAGFDVNNVGTVPVFPRPGQN